MTTESSPDRLDEVLVAAEARWQRHVDLLDWQPGYRVRGPEDPFTPAQEYAHHGHWLEDVLARLRARLDGTKRPPPVTDVDGQNAAWAAEDAARSHEEAKAFATAARDAYLEVAREAARTDQRVLDGLESMLVAHFDQHFGYMVTGMLEHESAQWERLTAILDARPRDTLHRGEDGVAWHAADVYAHLARWMDIQFPRVGAFLATGEVPELDATVEELNALWMAEDRDRPFEDARRHAFRTRDRFVRMIRDVPVDRWNARVLGWCAGNSVGHYQEHLAWIV